ncbi:hypothetical protein OFAG_02341 [Oxalobacter formigenes HOxBLS]|uniref:Uncharacterized protein n=1 Tax=Oxalobacter paraformigenes TaxID=556268 RepID=T5LPH0_9BURK|nr:hypothetical protein OFAG_02341 [Oxalobacter paraformigenes]
MSASREKVKKAGRNIISNRCPGREAESDKMRKPINNLKAFRMEEIICAIPATYRQAFVLHYTGRVAINGRIRIIKTRDAGMRIIRINHVWYYNRVNQIARIVALKDDIF